MCQKLIGAGSVIFTLNLLGDILSFPELAESEIALRDIDAECLRVAEIMERNVAEKLDVHQMHQLDSIIPSACSCASACCAACDVPTRNPEACMRPNTCSR